MERKMDTNEIMIEIDKKIDGRKEAIRHDISYLIDALTEIQSSIDMISYLSYLKDDLKQKIN